MQFSCESCKTQLQIADEKLRGKRLIVRCKRCGTKIALVDPAFAKAPPQAVRDEPAARALPAPQSDPERTQAMESAVLEKAVQASKLDDVHANGSPPTQRFAAPKAFVPADPAIWFAMLQGRQAGPLTYEEVEAHANEGVVGPRTYLWREGMDAWQRAKDIPEMVELFPRLPQPSRAPPIARPSRPEPKSPPPPSAGEPKAEPAAAQPAAPAPAPATPAAAAADPPGLAKPDALVRFVPPVVARTSPMFETAAPARKVSPFAIFLVVLGLATAFAILFIVLGAPAQKKEEPAEAASAAAPPGLTAEQVRRRLDEHKPALQSCVNEALRRDPGLKVGRIHVATTIAPTGEVTDARIDQRNVDDSPLGTCLKRATRQIVFPRFSGNPFDVDIPISVGAGE